MKIILFILIIITAIYIFAKIKQKRKALLFLNKLKKAGFYEYSRKYNLNESAKEIIKNKNIYYKSRRYFDYSLLEKMEISASDFINILKGILLRNNMEINEIKEEKDSYGNIILDIEGMKCEIYAVNQKKQDYVYNVIDLLNKFLSGINSKEKIYLLKKRKEIVFLTEDMYDIILSSKYLTEENTPCKLEKN